jgi:hypothetical protein
MYVCIYVCILIFIRAVLSRGLSTSDKYSILVRSVSKSCMGLCAIW